MVERLRLRLDRQLYLLLACVVLSIGSSFLFSFQPLIRPGVSTFFRGIVAGAGLVIIHLLGGVAREWCRRRWRIRYEAPPAPDGSGDKVGAAVLAGGGEEILLRGFIFAPLLTRFTFPGGAFLVFIINAALSGALHYRKGFFPFERIAEGILLGFLYQQYRSIFILFVARTSSELIWAFFGNRLQKRVLGEIWRAEV